MSALSEASTPAQDTGAPSIDTTQLHGQPQQLSNDMHQQQLQNGEAPPMSESTRKPKAPSVRRACAACHAGKTRCSEVLPCQSCLKRGLGASCAYPDPDADSSQNQSTAQVPFVQAPMYAPPPPQPPMHSLAHPTYYGEYTPFTNATPPSTSTFRPNKRPRPLTDEEAAAITRNFQRGAFFVGQSEPIIIDPRLPVKLTLAENDQVHFLIGKEALQ